MPIEPPANDRLVRCAVYTRKSTDRSLDAPVNSLTSQRDVCQAYIKVQDHRHWVELPHRYDDGGYSGGTLERPALQRMIGDIEAGRIDVVIIYKIDRLSRSLADFIRLMDIFERYGVGFVSVTQAFDTSDSMGRLVLNILLTFAQFEREIMSDRVRDKKAAMRRNGLFTGGVPPIGYRLGRGGRLVVDREWSDIVKEIFRRFPGMSARQIAKDFERRGIVTRRYRTKAGRLCGGRKLWPGAIIRVIQNPLYAGFFIHRGEMIEAKVEPLIAKAEWDRVQEIHSTRCSPVRDTTRNFLLGILHDELGRKMKLMARGPGRSASDRYYRTEQAGWARGTGTRNVLVEADRVEQLAISTVRAFLNDRIKLKESIFSLGLYSDEIARFTKGGQLAASRIGRMDNVHLRELFLALVPRAEVSKSGLRLFLSCHELCRFLAWDGKSIFSRSPLKPVYGADRFRLVYAPAALICGHPYFILPMKPHPEGIGSPDPSLVRLIMEAADLHAFMLANPSKSVSELAREKRMGPSFLARMLRLNYLAPDIQTAIIDGFQPATLTRHRILFGPMPLDWEQQRQLMGFN
ncbi:MAG: recombinase family protein [Sphingomicrobium sp.]